MIDITKKYRTRDGREVTQLVKFNTTDTHSIRGVCDNVIFSWREDGKYLTDSHYFDLIEVKEPMKISLWVNEESGRLITPDTYISYTMTGFKLKEFQGIPRNSKK